jgi:ABC-2 type transport system permease protein
VVLTGAALIREREHGTIEHLLALPLTPFEIAISKVWANGLVILLFATASIVLVIRSLLDVPIAGSLPLLLAGVVLYLFFATALSLYLGTVARSMAQSALLIILVVIVLQLLSGGSTPVEKRSRNARGFLGRISLMTIAHIDALKRTGCEKIIEDTANGA